VAMLVGIIVSKMYPPRVEAVEDIEAIDKKSAESAPD